MRQPPAYTRIVGLSTWCACFALAATAYGARDAQESAKQPTTEPDQLPEAVKTAVTQHVPDGQIVGFEQQVEQTRHLYFVDIKRPNASDVTLLASGRGQYLGLVEEDDKDDEDDVFINVETAPVAVREAAIKYFGKAEINSLFMEVEGERFIYCAEQTTGNKTRWASFTLRGVLIEEENEVALTELPAAVKDALAKAHPKAKIDSANLINQKEPTSKTFYAIDILDGSSKLELTITPDGQIENSEPDTDQETEPASPDKPAGSSKRPRR